MANTDYSSQLTAIYNKLVEIDLLCSKLTPLSAVNTMQVTLQTQLTSIASDLETLTQTVQSLQLTVGNLLTELRSK